MNPMHSELLIDPVGGVRCVHDETIDLTALGTLTIRRGSHVEPVPAGGWSADLAPVNGPVLGPFPTRSAALAAERDWLSRHWLNADSVND
jgi:hypothetical protein